MTVSMMSISAIKEAAKMLAASSSVLSMQDAQHPIMLLDVNAYQGMRGPILIMNAIHVRHACPT